MNRLKLLSMSTILASSLGAESDFQMILPGGYKKIAEHRFLSSKGYEDTKKDMAKLVQSSPKIQLIDEEINLPHVRSISYKNNKKNDDLFGINIYLNMQSGLTEVFFVSRK